MMKQGELLRIGELAKEAGVSLTTVKFYAKEGLIRPARKTGRNMAYYDRACVTPLARSADCSASATIRFPSSSG